MFISSYDVIYYLLTNLVNKIIIEINMILTKHEYNNDQNRKIKINHFFSLVMWFVNKLSMNKLFLFLIHIMYYNRTIKTKVNWTVLY